MNEAEYQTDWVNDQLALAEVDDGCPWDNDNDGNWWSSCGAGWVFVDGGPIENSMSYCPFCGQGITVV